MSENRPIPEATKLAQTKATNPRGSAWVSANAGSGKTYVLTRRVLRLLLDGQDPSTLLCLTFTKAAAAEMSARVFDELARWTRLDDAGLRSVLSDLQGRAGAREIAYARGLFARALETPGGLKIQTIHAFCESLLHQFPFEAGVAASFTVLDDRDADALMQAARARVIARAAKGKDEELTQAFDGLLARFADSSLNDHLDAILHARHALVRSFDAANVAGLENRLQHLVGLHAKMLGLENGHSRDFANLLAFPIQASHSLTRARVDALVRAAHDVGTDRDAERADGLLAAWRATTPQDATARWDDAFLTAAGKPRAVEKTYFAKAMRAEFLDVGAWLKAEQDRVLTLRTHAGFAQLMRMALAVLETFETLKNQRGALDFGDLIARTAALLTRSQAQAWVRYKMDQRINHILVDEAQDTSAQQWDIIAALSDDFFDGEGARTTAARETSAPTFFAVGDDKQSIYSFQGADPRHFHATRRALETKAARVDADFEAQLTLLLSFRSTRDVLNAVDAVFEREEARSGVTLDTGLVHEPYRRDPGQVVLWPVLRGSKVEEPEDWTQQPVDALPAPHLQLADAIAGRIASLVARGHQPGDILILLRTRGAMADAINRKLKDRAIAVAGTDRLLLTAHIAVEDMMALMQVALLPEDDLSLATLLTSPLIGLSDAQLEHLAAGRAGLLIDALNAPTDDPAIHQAALNVRHWRAMADYASPFTFLSTVLGRDGGRKRMLARLGEDARDPLDELLRLARAEETRLGSGLSNLEAFLDTLRRIKLDIKRDMDARADKVRIMTVHGAKGLEAKTVFLVDTCRLPRAPSGIVETVDEAASGVAKPPLLLLASDTHGPAYEAVKQAGQDRQAQEYRRLLYVAMTRARDQLIVTGHMPGDKEVPPGCWYDLIEKALGPDARDVGDLAGLPDGAPVRVWRSSPWPQGPSDSDAPPSEAERPTQKRPTQERHDLAPLRALLDAPLDTPSHRAPLRPSKARADSALSGQQWHDAAQAERHARTVAGLDQSESQIENQTSQALVFGTLVHRLLETPQLPSLESATGIASTLSETLDDASHAHALAQQALDQASAVRAMAEAAALFGARARAEVPIRGHVKDSQGMGRPVSGSIDRLVLRGDEVWAIDFKTNAKVPSGSNLLGQVPDYVAQMALYARLLEGLFAGKTIRCGLLWTAVPRLDWLANADLQAALDDLGIAQA